MSFFCNATCDGTKPLDKKSKIYLLSGMCTSGGYKFLVYLTRAHIYTLHRMPISDKASSLVVINTVVSRK